MKKSVTVALFALLVFGTATPSHAESPVVCDATLPNVAGCDFTGRDFFNGVFDGRDFSGTNLTGVSARYSYWVNTNLSGADFTTAQFYWAYMEGANLAGANLTNSSFTGSNLKNVDLSGANLTGITTGRLVGEPVNLPEGWKLVNGYLVGPGANLSGANLAGADLDGVSLVGANLKGVRSGGITGEATLPEGWVLVGGYLIGPGADLSYANLEGLAIWDADFTNVILTGAHVQGAAFIYPKSFLGTKSGLMTGQTHYGIEISNGYLIAPEADLSGAQLQDMDLNELSFKDANLVGADFTNSDLTGSDFTGADLTNANFTDANLTDAIFIESKIVNTKFNGATMTDTRLNSCEIRYAEFFGSKFLRTQFLMSSLFETKSQSVSGSLVTTGSVEIVNGVIYNVFVDGLGPFIEGNSQTFETLTLDAAFDIPAFAVVSVQWYRNDVPIEGATGPTYVTKATDVGSRIKASITVSKPGYLGRTDSTAEKVIAAKAMQPGKASIAGNARVGKNLSAKSSKWAPGVKTTYSWFRNGKAIKGATKSTYTVVAADKGKKLTVKITQALPGFQTTSRVSSAVKVR